MAAVCLPAGIGANVLQLLLLQPQAVRVLGQVQRMRHQGFVSQEVVASNLVKAKINFPGFRKYYN
jgi:hypothetical protein